MGAAEDSRRGALASNRRARRDYFVLERLEAGMALRGTEVKAIRGGAVSLAGSFARVENGEVWINNLTIPPYEYGNRFNHDPIRPRRLLLRRREINRLQAHVEQKGHVLVPLELRLRHGLIKVEIGICKGKRHEDRRETLRRRTADREAERAIAARR